MLEQNSTVFIKEANSENLHLLCGFCKIARVQINDGLIN